MDRPEHNSSVKQRSGDPSRLSRLRYWLRSLVWHRTLFMLPALAHLYRQRFGQWPKFLRPETFNEKLFVRMALDRRPLLTQLAGKFEARGFVVSRLGTDDLLPRLIASIRHPDDVVGLNLPARWIMKASHASGCVRIVTEHDPITMAEMRRLVAEWLMIDHGRYGLEWAYRDVARIVVVEELLEYQGVVPRDIKFFCFDGKVTYIQADSDRFDGHQQSLFDRNWQRLNVQVKTYAPHTEPVTPPQALTDMIEIAERLSAGIDFVRVDLYDLGARVMVGELTNYPQGGGGYFTPRNWDRVFGAHWTMPSLPVLRGWVQPRLFS